MSSIYDWSTTASSNGNSDAGINFAEGQSPKTVNNSARQVMGRMAEYIDDLGGNVTVGGTADAITITAASSFSAYATGMRLVFTAGADNPGATTINVNSIGAKSVRKIGSTGEAALGAGDLQEGSLYEVIYSAALNSTAGGWQLVSSLPVVSTENYVPTGSGMDFWGSTAPDGYIFAYGQAVSRTVYAALFDEIGTTYGSGDGSTTFNLPDKRGRGSYGKDDMGGSAAGRLTSAGSGVDGTALGSTGGAETHALIEAELAAHDHVASTTVTLDNNAVDVLKFSGVQNYGGGPAFNVGTKATIGVASAVTTITSAGSGDAHNNLPPGIVCNYIIKT